MPMKRFAWLLLVLLLSSACNGGQTGGGAKEAPMVSLKIATMGDGTLEGVISAYYAKYPKDRIELVAIPDEPAEAERFLRDKIAHGELDLVSFQTFMAKDGLLLDLGPYMQKSRFDLKPLGSAPEQLRWDGKRYDLPTAIYPEVLFYNKDLFKKQGLPEPKAGWSWEDLRETARRLTHQDGGAQYWGLTAQNQTSLVNMWLFQRTGVPHWQADEQSVKDAMQFFTTLIFSDKSVPKEANPTSPQWQSRRDFQAGKSGLHLANLMTQFQLSAQAPFAWDIAPLPTMQGRPAGVMVAPWTYGIPTTTKDPDGAWRFLSFLAGPEGAVAMAKMGFLPIYQTAEAEKAWFDRQPAPTPGTASLFGATWIIRPRTEDSVRMRVDMLLQQASGWALSGEKPWEEAHAEYVRRLDLIRGQ